MVKKLKTTIGGYYIKKETKPVDFATIDYIPLYNYFLYPTDKYSILCCVITERNLKSLKEEMKYFRLI